MEYTSEIDTERLCQYMCEQAEYSARFFIDAVRPIYGATENDRPIHIGSCVLLNISDKKFLLTAAHVIDENKYSSLYIAGNGAHNSNDGKLVLIEGDFYVTKKNQTKRDNDHYDFAFWQLDESTINKLGAVKFIDEKNMMITSRINVSDFFLALGYPNTKNKKINNHTHYVTSTLWHYWGQIFLNNDLSRKLNITGDDHLYLDYDFKKNATSDGKITNATKPTGASGGVIVNIEYPTQNKLQDNSYVEGKIAGLIIEGHKDQNAIVCTKLHLILKAIYSQITEQTSVS